MEEQEPEPAGPPSAAPSAATQLAEASGWIGRVVDERYRVTELLGEGGMGAVFEAQHLKLHKSVALKVIRAELAGNGEVAIRFAREAMATAQFEHPHVASAIDYGSLPEGGAYFVMQLVRGKSLRALLNRDARMPWARAAELGAQVADALSAARAENIVHRDLKPDNILVETREDGSELVKILDFGIAHVAPTDAPAPEGAQAHRALTRVGTIMGTPGYMSPEQAVGDKVDHRTDLYALGVVLWEAITGKELWDAPDVTAVIARQMTEDVPPLRSMVDDPTLPVELDQLVLRLTARKANDRPDHAGEVRDELRRLAAIGGAAPVTRLSFDELRRHGARGAGEVARVAKTSYTRWRSQPVHTRRVQLGAAGGVAALVLLLTLVGGDEPAAAGTAATPATPAAEGSAGQAGATPAKAVVEPVEEGQEAEDKNAIAQAVEAAVDAVTPGPRVPKELEDDVEDLLEGESVRVRRRAARKIAKYKPASAIDEYIRVIAQLDNARSCKTRRAAIDRMEEMKDERFLPVLRRYGNAPKTGCGFLSLEDCYGCIRGDVRHAINAIED